MGKAVPDGLVGLGGYPQPLGGLVPSRFLHDPPGYQFPLPAGIGGDDQFLVGGDEQGVHSGVGSGDIGLLAANLVLFRIDLDAHKA